jgi:hypothetical protein
MAALAALAALVSPACGTTPTPPDTTPHVVPQTIMILDARPVPEELTVAVGERVSFMNHDTTSYTVAGGREPSSPDCPEITVVGMLEPGHTRPTEPFTSAKTCAFHVSRGQTVLLSGRIIIR